MVPETSSKPPINFTIYILETCGWTQLFLTKFYELVMIYARQGYPVTIAISLPDAAKQSELEYLPRFGITVNDTHIMYENMSKELVDMCKFVEDNITQVESSA